MHAQGAQVPELAARLEQVLLGARDQHAFALGKEERGGRVGECDHNRRAVRENHPRRVVAALLQLVVHEELEPVDVRPVEPLIVRRVLPVVGEAHLHLGVALRVLRVHWLVLLEGQE